MKITKRQLKRIIKEEKQKLIKEMRDDPINRARGTYANDSLASGIERNMEELYVGMIADMEEDGHETEEAEDLAAEVLIQILSSVLGTMGHLHANLSLKG